MTRRIYYLFIALFVAKISFAQNLILNGNFEDVNICTEMNAPCSPEAWRQTCSILATNVARYSFNYSGFVVYNLSVNNVRSYLQSRLGDNLQYGKNIESHLKFYLKIFLLIVLEFYSQTL